MAALNQQTAQQFQQYAAQQYPGNAEQVMPTFSTCSGLNTVLVPRANNFSPFRQILLGMYVWVLWLL